MSEEHSKSLIESHEDSDKHHDASNPNDSDFAPPNTQPKPKRIRKSTVGIRKVQHKWKDAEIVRLIAAVEQRRTLWDFGSSQYKFSKLDCWRDVVNELGVVGIDVNEAKTKWSSLRVTFKVNLAKMREKKSGQGTSDSSTVVWRHFKQMMFLEANDVRKSTSSTPTMDLESADNEPILDDFPHLDSPQPTSEATVESRRKCRCSTVLTPTSPASSSSSNSSSRSQCAAILSNAVAALETSDRNSTFCDNILSELRALSDDKAYALRRILNRAMWNFLDVCEAEKSLLR